GSEALRHDDHNREADDHLGEKCRWSGEFRKVPPSTLPRAERHGHNRRNGAGDADQRPHEACHMSARCRYVILTSSRSAAASPGRRRSSCPSGSRRLGPRRVSRGSASYERVACPDAIRPARSGAPRRRVRRRSQRVPDAPAAKVTPQQRAQPPAPESRPRADASGGSRSRAAMIGPARLFGICCCESLMEAEGKARAEEPAQDLSPVWSIDWAPAARRPTGFSTAGHRRARRSTRPSSARMTSLSFRRRWRTSQSAASSLSRSP
ncbi:MAG: hypothetical protein QOI08_3001, partial [Actinomycetota bacterium]|nr:hypothetical protein [Actinomycetota bacterium]